jgi:hypothetical protein
MESISSIYDAILLYDIKSTMSRARKQARKRDYDRKHGLGIYGVFNREKAQIDSLGLSQAERDAEIQKLSARLGIN